MSPPEAGAGALGPAGQGPAGPRAEVVPLGPVHEVACAVAAAHLAAVLGLPCRQAEPRPLPAGAFLPARGQYDAAIITADLGRGLEPGLLRVGVTEADLCLPVFSFVFGEADLGRRVALASLHRLRADDPGRQAPRPALYTRLAKVVCHEAGHALGLTHCHQPACLMRFAGDQAGVDRLPLGLCPACALGLARRRAGLAGGPDAAAPPA